MPQPTLSSFEENASKMSALQKENEIIRKGLLNLMKSEEMAVGSEPPLQGFDELIDDFCNISQSVI